MFNLENYKDKFVPFPGYEPENYCFNLSLQFKNKLHCQISYYEKEPDLLTIRVQDCWSEVKPESRCYLNVNWEEASIILENLNNLSSAPTTGFSQQS